MPRRAPGWPGTAGGFGHFIDGAFTPRQAAFETTEPGDRQVLAAVSQGTAATMSTPP
jgi:aldehyde dehydrogenase (NAD+)